MARAAAVRVVEAKATATLSDYGAAPVTDPLSALASLAGEIASLKDHLRQRVAALRGEEWRYTGRAGEQLRAEVAAYERALDRTGRILVEMARLGIDERLARVEEWQATILFGAVEAALRALGLDAGQQQAARRLIAAELRAAAMTEGEHT